MRRCCIASARRPAPSTVPLRPHVLWRSLQPLHALVSHQCPSLSDATVPNHECPVRAPGPLEYGMWRSGWSDPLWSFDGDAALRRELAQSRSSASLKTAQHAASLLSPLIDAPDRCAIEIALATELKTIPVVELQAGCAGRFEIDAARVGVRERGVAKGAKQGLSGTLALK